MKLSDIDWTDPDSQISDYFKVHEALWLPSWRIYHRPSSAEKYEIHLLAKSMDKIREFVDEPISVHCWIRPKVVNAPYSEWHRMDYNMMAAHSTATKSGHIFGCAVDFHVVGYAGPERCHIVRQTLIPKLEEFDVRMEDIDGGWIHIDRKPVVHNRFFKP